MSNQPYYSVCARCGATLDPGEKCDCEKPKRAKCPLFMERFDHGGISAIHCRLRTDAGYLEIKTAVRDRAIRDQFYADYCCGDYESCNYFHELVDGVPDCGIPMAEGYLDIR